MKRLFHFVVFVAAVAVVLWLLRDRLVRDAEPLPDHPPRFRHPEPSAPPAASEGPERDDLTELSGVGPAYAQRLASSGITSFAALAAADAADLAGYIDVAESQVAGWIAQARQRT